MDEGRGSSPHRSPQSYLRYHLTAIISKISPRRPQRSQSQTTGPHSVVNSPWSVVHSLRAWRALRLKYNVRAQAKRKLLSVHGPRRAGSERGWGGRPIPTKAAAVVCGEHHQADNEKGLRGRREGLFSFLQSWATGTSRSTPRRSGWLSARRSLGSRPQFPSPRQSASRLLKNPSSPRLLKKVQMQGGARRAE